MAHSTVLKSYCRSRTNNMHAHKTRLIAQYCFSHLISTPEAWEVQLESISSAQHKLLAVHSSTVRALQHCMCYCNIRPPLHQQQEQAQAVHKVTHH